MSVTDTLTDMITPVLNDSGYRLWDLTVTKAGKRSIVSVTLDKNGGMTVDDIAEMSKTIAPLLDESESLGDSYHLEVASPGLERSLIRPEHFEFSLGSDVTVSHRVEGALVRTRGKLSNVTDDDIQVETEEGSVTIALSSITKAHTLFDFDQALKDGPITNNAQEKHEVEQ